METASTNPWLYFLGKEFINFLKFLLFVTKSIKSFEAITSPVFNIKEESLIPESIR